MSTNIRLFLCPLLYYISTEVTDFVSEGCTIIYVAIEGKAVGFISLADTLRPDAPNVVSEIRVAGAIPVLLTGDHENVAKTIATSLSIREFHAACLPEDKLKFIMTYQEKKEKVCMIGDGINDAPALKKAHVGIAMGGVGSDIAVDAAGRHCGAFRFYIGRSIIYPPFKIVL